MFGQERSYFRYVVLGLVGLMLVGFVIIAPNGIVGLVQERLRRKRS